MAAFLISALTMAALIFTLSLSIAYAQDRVVYAMRAGTWRFKIWGGRILILVGLWLISLSLWSDFFATVFSP